MFQRILIGLALLLILGVPFVLHGRGRGSDAAAVVDTKSGDRLVIVTPHVPQIRTEFAEAFDRWHKRKYGTTVFIDWRVPGGTSEILKALEGQYIAAAKEGQFDFADPLDPKAKPGTVAFDLMFGGGSFDHGRLKTGVKVKLDATGPNQTGKEYVLPMSAPAGFSKEQLIAWFGSATREQLHRENPDLHKELDRWLGPVTDANRNEVVPNLLIGAQTLYDPGAVATDKSPLDPGQFWIGSALSGFGIVYNKDLCAQLGLPEPTGFNDLTSPKLQGWVLLADPRQSGSVTTTLDSILSTSGWDDGWRILREMSANARAFVNSSPKPPIDVSAGEAAMALAIDFYGRGQSQAILKPGQDPATSRVGYVDPKGATYIDADPISLLRGAPNPELARRFIAFCLTDEAQSLWQFHARTTAKGANNPKGEDGSPLGPRVNELRRMPVTRSMYDRFTPSMVDQTNAFTLATRTTPKGWRSSIGVMMGAFAIDNAHELREAWRVLNIARAKADFPPATLKEMESLFYAWPTTTLADGTVLEFKPTTVRDIVKHWRAGGQAACEIQYTAFFRANYKKVVALAKVGGVE